MDTKNENTNKAELELITAYTQMAFLHYKTVAQKLHHEQ